MAGLGNDRMCFLIRAKAQLDRQPFSLWMSGLCDKPHQGGRDDSDRQEQNSQFRC